MQAQPYLFFKGRCDAGAGEGCAGGMLQPGFENKVMHRSLIGRFGMSWMVIAT